MCILAVASVIQIDGDPPAAKSDAGSVAGAPLAVLRKLQNIGFSELDSELPGMLRTLPSVSDEKVKTKTKNQIKIIHMNAIDNVSRL